VLYQYLNMLSIYIHSICHESDNYLDANRSTCFSYIITIFRPIWNQSSGTQNAHLMGSLYVYNSDSYSKTKVCEIMAFKITYLSINFLLDELVDPS
jgi:hypothetical protein